MLSKEQLSWLEEELYYHKNAEGQSVPVEIYLRNSILPSGYGLDEDSNLSVYTLENHPEVIRDFVLAMHKTIYSALFA